MSEMSLQDAVAFLRPFADKCCDADNDMIYGRENVTAGRALKAVLAALPPVATAPVVDAGEVERLREALVEIRNRTERDRWRHVSCNHIHAIARAALAATPTPPAGER